MRTVVRRVGASQVLGPARRGRGLVYLATAYALLAATAAGGASAAGASPAQQSKIQVPFTTLPGHLAPIVQATIDGQTAALVVDTGSSVDVFSASFAARLGLKPEPRIFGGKPFMFDGKPTDCVTAASLDIGGVRQRNVVFAVLDASQFANGVGAPIDGAVGLNTLGALAVLFDFGAQQVTFFSPGDLDAREVGALGFRLDRSAPLTRSNRWKLYSVPVNIQNGAYSEEPALTVDTGGEATTIPRRTSDLLHLKASDRFPIKTAYLGDLSASVVGPITIGIGSLEERTTIAYVDDEAVGLPVGLRDDVLSRSRALLDFPGGRAYIAMAGSGPGQQQTAQVQFTTPLGFPAPVVQATIDDTTPASLIVDTGTTNDTIAASLAAKLGLKQSPVTDHGRQAMLNGAPEASVTAHSVELGTARLHDISFVVVSDKSLLNPNGPPANGVVGLATLRQAAWLIDFTAREITMYYPGKLSDHELTALGFRSDQAAPLTFNEGLGLYTAPVTLRNGPYTAKATLRLDTGMGSTVISKATSDSLHLPVVAKDVYSDPQTGNSTVSIVGPVAMRLGPLTASGTVGRPNTDDADWPPCVASDFLSTARILLDLPAGKLYLAPTNSGTGADPPAPPAPPGPGAGSSSQPAPASPPSSAPAAPGADGSR